MSDITILTQMKFDKGSVVVERNSGVVTVSVSGTHAVHLTQNIGTSAENLGKGGITNVGYAMFHNLDGTNFVLVGYDDSGFKDMIKVKAGEWSGPVRLSQNTPQAKADTGALDLEYILIED